MILRRLSQSLKEQNWTAIVIEFVLLVAGVFLGIQVANWNADRVAETQSKVFTDRLRADLRIEAWNYEFMIQYFGEVHANAEKTLAVLEGRSELSNEQLIIAAYRATQYNTPSRRRAAFDELISTGNITLIKDQRLRDAASMIYANNGILDTFVTKDMESRYREEFRMRIPMEVQSALAERCGDRFVPVGSFKDIPNSLDYPCSSGLSQRTIDNAAGILRSSDAFTPLLRLRLADLKTVVSNLTISNQDSRNSLQVVLGATP